MVAKKEVAKKEVPAAKEVDKKEVPIKKEVPKPVAKKAAPVKAVPAKEAPAKKAPVKKAPVKKAAPAKPVKEAPQDNSRYITKTAIRYLARRAGIKRLDKSVYDSVLKYVEVTLRNLLQKSVVFAVHLKKRTLQQNHVDSALRFMGTPVALACANNIKTLLEKHVNRKTKKPEEGKERTRHFKQGTIALRDIRHEQKQSDRAAMRFLPFQRFVRDIAATLNGELRISRNVFMIAQLYIEAMVVRVLQYANLCAIHSNRTTVQPTDVDLVLAIRAD